MLEKLASKTGEEVPLKVCWLSKTESAEHLENLKQWMREQDEIVVRHVCKDV